MTYQRYKKKTEYTGPTRASINRSTMQGWVDVISPFNSRYIEDLKTVIQPSHRKWDPDQRVWHVNEIFLEELVGLLKMHFDEVVTDLTEPPTDNMFVPLFAALQGMPDGTMDKVYRTLSQALHPDHGGSTELMSKLNNAYDEVKK